MYSIDLNIGKNRILIKLSGSFTLDEMKKCVDETIMAAKKLQHGYDVITDITQMGVSTPEVTKEIERAQRHFATSGARKGVRIVGKDHVITGMQFKRTGGAAGYNSVNVNSMAQAELELEK